MAYFTKSEARAAAKSRLAKSTVVKSSSDLLRESAKATKSTDLFDIFLSHSVNDAELVQGIKLLLEERGFSVYVDWDTDAHLDRSSVTKATAELLRTRMRQSSSLIYLATNNASSSKWMPWELGYFDGHRKAQVAVMPLMDSETEAFAEQEYLNLYPLVTKDRYTSGAKDLFVEARGAKWSTLNAFGAGKPQWNAYSRD